MAYQAANRLATVDEKVVQFDADGNMTRGPMAGELTNFGFDSRNRLVQADDTVYHYDAENQRIGINQIQYVVNSQPALSQVLVKEDNGQKTFYVYGLGLIGQESNGEYLSYHFDFRGSTVALTDDTAQVIERFQYSPYGVLLSGDSSITPFLFNGMYGVMSDGNGLYYMRARFYSPSIRRFVNQDILLGSVAEGQSLNRYAFVTGQPVNFIDPFGLEGMYGLSVGYDMGRLNRCSCGNVDDLLANARSETPRDWKLLSDRSDLHYAFISGEFKCNLFVDLMFEKSGYTLPNIGGGWLARFFSIYPPGAANSSDPKYKIPDWPVISDEPKPGDFAAQEGHMGIVTKKGITISASPNGVVENNWGFRDNQPDTIFRRCSNRN